MAASGMLLAMVACSVLDPLDGLSGAGGGGDDSGDALAADGQSGDATGDTTHGSGGDGSVDSASDAPHDGFPPADAVNDPGPASTGLRRLITVTAGADPVPAGYAVQFTLDTASLIAAGKLRADLADLRVTDAAGTGRDRIVDALAPSVIWFALASAIAANASDTYWVDYAAPDAGTPPANGANVFAFYDDFPGTQPASHWITLGAPVVANHQLTLRHWNPASSTDPDSLRTDYQTDNVPTASALEFFATVTVPGSAADVTNGFWWWLGFQHQNDFAASDPWIIWIQRGTSTVRSEQYIAGNPHCSTAACASQDAPLDALPHRYRIERAPSATRFYMDDVLRQTVADPNVTDYSLMMRNWTQTSDVLVTVARARPLVDSEPTTALGAEQPSP
jgi:hypothetical protein